MIQEALVWVGMLVMPIVICARKSAMPRDLKLSAHARNIMLATFSGLGVVNLQGYEIKVTKLYVVL